MNGQAYLVIQITNYNFKVVLNKTKYSLYWYGDYKLA